MLLLTKLISRPVEFLGKQTPSREIYWALCKENFNTGICFEGSKICRHKRSTDCFVRHSITREISRNKRKPKGY